jgi:hypothetical protein
LHPPSQSHPSKGCDMKSIENLASPEQLDDPMFAPGAFVILHHGCKVAGRAHPDAGRIGRIVSRDGKQMVTEFFNDELIGSTQFCLIPFGHWAPVPEFFVEAYEPRAKRRGWRLSPAGVKMFDAMGWERTTATVGES